MLVNISVCWKIQVDAGSFFGGVIMAKMLGYYIARASGSTDLPRMMQSKSFA